MAVKKCCIDNCKSCSTRKEDKGVTYHKFPKDITLCNIWKSVTHKYNITDLPKYVCSRHFCKNDFQIYKDSKYVLKSDAVPSIFPWTNRKTVKKMESKKEISIDENTASCFKESVTDSVDALRKYIAAQEKEIQEQSAPKPTAIVEKTNDDSMDSRVSQSETISVASSVIDMIMNESELEIARKKDMKNKVINTIDKGNSSMALSVGSKVEAKDFGDEWYSAEIIEVDYDEMEVLVHYETETKKHDEWISVSSPRLRPAGSSTIKLGPSSAESWSSDNMTATTTSSTKEDPKDEKVEQKVHPTFVVGERCLARWRDNRRFVATIRNDLGNGSYEIIFDDGCHWTCKVSRLYKLKPGKGGVTSGAPNTASPSAEFAAGPSNASPTQYPAFHTHLFDPTRDYLGSKSERREMKRKLNIKEIFNIGQKRPKTQKIQKDKVQKTPTEKKPRIIRRKPMKLKQEVKVKVELKPDIPAADAVASIIGTFKQEVKTEEKKEPVSEINIEEKPIKIEVAPKDETKSEQLEDSNVESAEEKPVSEAVDDGDKIELDDLKPYLDPEVLEEEMKLEQFEKPDEGTHEEVIDRIKEAINKLEGGLSQTEQTNSPKPEIKPEAEVPKKENPVESGTTEPATVIPEEKPAETSPEATGTETKKESKKKLSKIKKGKKLRMLREKKVKKQVEKVKSELEEMKKQVEEMRKQMIQSQELAKEEDLTAKFLLPGEWCCKWVNGQPLGTVSEIECEVKQDASGKVPLPRRSVQVEDKRLPEGWTKHMVRRSLGNSAGKWDVVLVGPDNRRFHTKNEMRVYLENHPDQTLRKYEYALTDFGVHLKLSRRMGWISHTPDGLVDGPDHQLPVGTLSSTSPLVKRKSLGLKRKSIKVKNKIPKLTIKMKVPKNAQPYEEAAIPVPPTEGSSADISTPPGQSNLEHLSTPALEDGYVFVGSLKVQIIENLLRCPAEGCFKNFRNTTLLQMHIKHYHRDLRKMMGATPKVLDLAYARTMPVEAESPRVKEDNKIIKVKIPRPPKPKPEREESKLEIVVDRIEPLQIDIAQVTPIRETEISIPRSQDSPKLRQALINKPVKRPRVLLPVRRVEPQEEQSIPDSLTEELDFESTEPIEPLIEIPPMENLDFETAISTHTVTKPLNEKKRKSEKKRKPFVLPPKAVLSEEEDWFTVNSDVDTRSSFPRSGTPDSKVDKAAPVSSESNEDNKDANTYINEHGELIKIVHMKREEIINCHCGFREEDGLMVQCELCLCWQHAICLNIQRQGDVPEKYTCSMCLNPRRGRRSARFTHDQDRLYEGLLPAAAPCAALRRAHELAGNLLRLDDALHALRVKYVVATKKDHPKLYLWAKDWEQVEIQYTQEKLNSDYSDLNIMISNIGKENLPTHLPIKPDDVKDMPLDIRTSPSEENEHDRFSQRDIPLGSQSLLSGLLSSPGGASLDLPISTSELERLAKSVQEQECQRASIAAPQPEAAIENSVCRERLLRHIQRCQALIDSRLDSIEAQVAELESQNPSFEDDESAEFIPRTKQTIQMLMRDLDTMEELGVIT